jgi:hypothetical protein
VRVDGVIPGGAWWWPGLVLGLLMVAFAARRAVAVAWTVRAMVLTPPLSRHLSRWVKPRSYSDEEFFRADGACEPWIEQRKAALDRLSRFFRAQHARSMAWGDAIRESFSDLRFTDAISPW